MRCKIDPRMPHFPEVINATETMNGIDFPKAVSCYSTYLRVLYHFNHAGIDYLRDSTRPFYNAIGNYTSGWSSVEVTDLKKYNSYLTPTEQKKSVCKDHWLIPQPFSNFLLTEWIRFKEWDEFFKAWMMCSQTIKVTSIQNEALSMFTHESDDGIVQHKVSVPTHERYDILGIKCSKEVIGTSKTFPYEELTSDCLEIFKDWMKFEEENMLEPSLLKKVSIAEIQDKVESEKEDIDYVIENFGH